MPDSAVEDIKGKLNIVDVVADYVPLKKAGVNFRARCPFHNEKSPSFYVSPVRQIWHCFGCSLGGDVFEFVKQIEGLDFRQALELLAERAGVTLPARAFMPSEPPDRKRLLYELNQLAAKFYHQILLKSPKAEAARAYLTHRKFSPATISAWQIGYAVDLWGALYGFLKKRGYQEADMAAAGLVVKSDNPANSQQPYFDRFRDRITFPILDASGRTVGFSARLLHEKEGAGKYINSPESPIYNKSQVLYGFYQARTEIRKSDLAVVVEGNVDVIKSHQVGIKYVVASSGTALTESQLDRLGGLTHNLTFAFDADAAGVAAARRAVELALNRDFAVRLIRPVAGLKDADEMIDKGPELWRQAVSEAPDFLDFYFHQLFDILPKDARSKARAIDEFLTLLVKVPQPVVVAHYLPQLAAAVSVKEQIITERLKRLRLDQRSSPVRAAATSVVGLSGSNRPGAKGTSETPPTYVLELYFLGELLKTSEERLKYYWNQHRPEHFLAPTMRQLFETLGAYAGGEGESLAAFYSAHPEVKGASDLALFAVEVSEEGERTEQAGKNELRELSRRLTLAFLHRQKDELARGLAEAEKAGRTEDRLRLASEYNQIVQKIAEAQ